MRLNEFGEIVRDDKEAQNPETEIPTFTPPAEPIIEPVSAKELEDIKKEFAHKKQFEPVKHTTKSPAKEMESENE